MIVGLIKPIWRIRRNILKAARPGIGEKDRTVGQVYSTSDGIEVGTPFGLVFVPFYEEFSATFVVDLWEYPEFQKQYAVHDRGYRLHRLTDRNGNVLCTTREEVDWCLLHVGISGAEHEAINALRNGASVQDAADLHANLVLLTVVRYMALVEVGERAWEKQQ